MIHSRRPVCFPLMALGIACALIGSTNDAEAKVFRNSYVSFELPEKWDCVLELTEWVCRPKAPDQAQQAIIVLTAKEVGPSDSLPAYETHLKTQRTIASRTGQALQSQVLKVEQRKIAMHPWIDGMHIASEVPNYYTRYLATTKDKIAILVTFSAHKLHYTKFSSDFFKAIESLRVVASKGLLAGSGDGSGSGVFGGTGSQLDQMIDGEMPPEEGSGEDGLFGQTTQTILGLALLIGAIGVYLLLKRGKKKKKPSRSSGGGGGSLPPSRR